MFDLFGYKVRSEVVIFCVVEFLGCFIALYLLPTPQFLGEGPERPSTIAFAALLGASSGLVSRAAGLHQAETWHHYRRIVASALVSNILLMLLALLVLMACGAMGQWNTFWHDLSTTGLKLFIAITLGRLLFAVVLRSDLFTRRLILLQEASGASVVERTLDAAGAFSCFTVVLRLTPEQFLRRLTPDWRRGERLWAVVAGQDIVLSPSLLARCQVAGLQVFRDGEFCEHYLRRLDTDSLPADWVATARGSRETRLDAALRRGFDVTVSLLVLLATLPLLLLTALAIRLDSPGPIFYRQLRVGRGGQVFNLCKFRSMVVDAEANGQARWASRQDARVTRVGRFIRLTRIDEIPQVLNVLRGDMAFIGPRPERPTFVAQLGRTIAHYNDRAVVKPGITGWAQVRYPYGASVEDARHKLAYDLYYVRHHSLLLDLLILVDTLRVVLFQQGAR